VGTFVATRCTGLCSVSNRNTEWIQAEINCPLLIFQTDNTIVLYLIFSLYSSASSEREIHLLENA
jgi:hypothetical protein